MDAEIVPLRPAEITAAPPLLTLNNAHALELSLLDAPQMAHLVGEAFLAARIGEADALILAFDQEADYDGLNFQWFKARFDRFVYVDRVVVAEQARGRGLARALYLRLFDLAKAAGHERITCEINADPPNPASDAFHAALGFEAIGEARLPNGKTVRYFERRLGRTTIRSSP